MDIGNIRASRPSRIAAALVAIAALVAAAIVVLEVPQRDSGTAERDSNATTEPAGQAEPAEQGRLRMESVAASPATTMADDAAATAPKPQADAGRASGPSAAAVDLGLKVIKSGEITLEVTGDRRFDLALEEIAAIAHAAGGYVATTSLADTRRQRALLSLRVPAKRLESVMVELRQQGKVRSRSLSGEDVTAEYVDTESRLRHARAVEQRLLDLLARAGSVQETLMVQDRLANVQRQIEVDQGRLNQLDKLTEMATINVTLRTRTAAKDDRKDDGVGFLAALEDAGAAFMDNINGGVVWLGGALPVLLLLGIAGVATRSAWRSRPPRRSADQPGD